MHASLAKKPRSRHRNPGEPDHALPMRLGRLYEKSAGAKNIRTL
ncbi:MAG TPA: hypothetical protein VF553_00605 [Pyrinomonadaceae bacterium]|jgi:hypothetical protein